MLHFMALFPSVQWTSLIPLSKQSKSVSLYTQIKSSEKNQLSSNDGIWTPLLLRYRALNYYLFLGLGKFYFAYFNAQIIYPHYKLHIT